MKKLLVILFLLGCDEGDGYEYKSCLKEGSVLNKRGCYDCARKKDEWKSGRRDNFPLEVFFSKYFCKYRIDGIGDTYYDVSKEFVGYVWDYISEEDLKELFPTYTGYDVEQCVSEEEEVKWYASEQVSHTSSGDNACWCFNRNERITRVIVEKEKMQSYMLLDM